MIRKFQENDIDTIMEFWLEENLQTHSYIIPNYWRDNFDLVKRLMTEATIYVSEYNGEINGFVGMMDNTIAGIFVSSKYQSQGFGALLMTELKSRYDYLVLQVYKKNHRAIKFYRSEKFIIKSDQFNEGTNEIEYVMEWNN